VRNSYIWEIKKKRGDGKMEIYKTIKREDIDVEREILREKRIKALSSYTFLSPEYREYLRKQIASE